MTARALRFHSFGLDHLKLEEITLPELGAYDVHVRFRAASLNFRDTMIVAGKYDPNLKMPRIPGSDAAGEVVAIGPGVTRFQPGDRVASLFFQTWHAGQIQPATAKSALGGGIDGVFATERVLPEGGLIRIPDSLTWEEAATLSCAGLTAWNALVEAGNIRAGETVVTLGTGGVSVFAIQFAKIHGARVIATSSSDTKLQQAAALGADILINYKTTPNWEEEVFRITHKTGADHVVEVGGAGTLPRSLKATRPGGQVHLIGVLTGPGEGVNPADIFRKAIRVNGIFVGSRAMFEHMNAAIEQSQLKPVVDTVIPIESFRDAFDHMQRGSHFGKVVLSM